jgi:predicted MFS family arabinose efflux permease
MILSYLEQKDWFEYKAMIYGRTRSYSLIGSSVSSFLSLIIILNIPATRWVFLITTIPYVVDFALIASYPASLNEKSETNFTYRQFIRLSWSSIKSIFSQTKLVKVIMNSSSYDALFKTIKDYIQPILILLIASESDQTIKIYLGVIYGVFFIFSAIASRNVHHLKQYTDSAHLMDIMFYVQTLALFMIAMSITFTNHIFTILLFFVLYTFKDMRRPLFLDVSSDHMAKKERATALSVESQMRSLLIIIMAPLFGLFSDTIGLSFAFIGMACLSMIFSLGLRLKKID